ncbi:Predicted thioesterase [gamma proteobacterium HdN1]|nr:Predicted thioesterase [gamma proteobacterium HdN1]
MGELTTKSQFSGIQVRVYLEDTDAGGIVYYVNYLRFMERARTELLRHLGFDFVRLDAEGFKFVVHKAQVEYHSPALMDDELFVTAELEKLAKTYVVFQQNVYRQQQLLCSARIQVACITVSGLKPAAMPPMVRERFSRLAQPD